MSAKIPGAGKKVVFVSPEGMGRSEIFQLLKQKEPPHEGNIRPAPNMARLKVKTAEREGSVVSWIQSLESFEDILKFQYGNTKFAIWRVQKRWTTHDLWSTLSSLSHLNETFELQYYCSDIAHFIKISMFYLRFYFNMPGIEKSNSKTIEAKTKHVRGKEDSMKRPKNRERNPK